MLSPRRVLVSAIVLAAATLSSGAVADPLTDAERTERCVRIRDVAADNGISAGYLLAGIAQAETSLSHCWEELSWACQGPDSPDCAGPVVAGAGDGPCSLMEGGLGMFQFDGGTFDETIERDGDGVLLLAGNVTRAIDFVLNMVVFSQYVDVDTPEEAKAWLNTVTVGGPQWDAWIKTVTHYYNGCVPGTCGVYNQRYQHYSDAGTTVFEEQGADFWVVDIPPCAPIPAEGRLLEETDTCFTKGGPLPFWRVGIGGESNLHIWTGTIEGDQSVNFAEWSLSFDEEGLYQVEVSVPKGTSTQAAYLVEHAGEVSTVVVDQSAAADGFVDLGSFEFDTGVGQRVSLGDNTGDTESRRISVDALRLTRLDGGGGEGGGSAGPGSTSAGGGGDDGFGGAGGGDDLIFDGDDEGCSCAVAPDPERSDGRSLALLAAAGLLFGRGRRRR